MIKLLKTYCYISAFLPLESFLTSIIVIFYLEYIGLTFIQYTNYLSLLIATSLILEIPMGYISDKIGNRLAILLGRLISALGFSLFFLIDAKDPLNLSAIAITLAVAQSLSSGNLPSIIYKTFKSHRKDNPNNYKEFLTQINIITIGMSAFFTLGGGYLYDIKPYLPMVLDIGIILINCLFTFIFLILLWPKIKNTDENDQRKNHLNIKVALLKVNKTRFFIALFFSAMLFSLLRISLNFYQPILKTNGWDGTDFGVLFSVGIIFSTLISYATKKFIFKYLNYHNTVVFFIIFVLSLIILFYQEIQTPIFFILGFFIHQIFRIIIPPVFDAETQQSIHESEDLRTTIISFSLLVKSLIVSIGLYLSGIIIEITNDFQQTLTFIHLIIFIFIIIAFWILTRLKSNQIYKENFKY